MFLSGKHFAIFKLKNGIVPYLKSAKVDSLIHTPCSLQYRVGFNWERIAEKLKGGGNGDFDIQK